MKNNQFIILLVLIILLIVYIAIRDFYVYKKTENFSLTDLF
jgi:hypothetical protein